MGNFRVVQLTNDDGEFYRLVGPFLSRREIVTELGASVWDDPGKIWFIAMDGTTVVGFAAILRGKIADHLCSVYVLPKHRRQGVFTLTLAAALTVCSGSVTVTARDCAKPALQAAGFAPVTTASRNAFTRMVKEAR